MLKANRQKLKEISLALSSLHDELVAVRLNEEMRFEDVSQSEWESYKVQTELAPCGDLDEAISSMEQAMVGIRDALTI